MKRRNWLRTSIAMLTLIATVLETGFTPVSTLAAEFTNEDGIVVNNDAIEEAEQSSNDGELQMEVTRDSEEPAAEEAAPEEQPEENADLAESSQESNVVEGDTLEEAQDGETSEEAADGEVIDSEATEGNVVDGEELVEETGNTEAAEEEVFEEAEELKKEGTLSVTDSGISGSGYDEISIYVNTDDLANKDKFRVEFTGPASASYNPVLNDELDKTNGGRYDFEGLEGGDFTVRATSSDDVILSYRYNEDGYPEIVVESKPVEKILETKTLTSVDDAEIQAITGEGFESVTVNLNTEELSEKAAFKLIVESDADATVDGYDAKSGITGLDKNTGSLTIEGLEEESFTAYVISDNDEVQIKTIAEINSVEDGEATFTVDNVDTKREYGYEDDKVKVTATLEKADAVPDDAYFDVTPLTEEEAEKYLEALNKDKDEENGDVLATADNTLLYNIGFYTDDTKSEEIEPEEGSVAISIEFKKEQLSEELGAEEPEDLVVTHIKEDGSDITTEEVDASASVDEGVIEFDTDSMSIWAITNITENGTITTAEIAGNYDFVASLGDGYDYGVIAQESFSQAGDTETNMMVGLYSSNNPDLGASSNYSNAGGNNFFGDVADGTTLRFHQAPANIYLGPDATTKYNNGNLTIDKAHISDNTVIHENSDINVGNVISGIDTYYSNYFDKGTVIKKTTTGAQRFPTIDLRNQDDGVYIIKSDSTFMDKDTDGLDIYLNPGQRLIINCTATELTLQRWHLNGQQPSHYVGSNDDVGCNDEYGDWATTAVVFYMPNATKVTMTESMGVVIAPNAHVTRNGGACGGILVCKSTDAGNEWHYHNHNLPSPSKTQLKLYAIKQVDGAVPDSKYERNFEFGVYPYDHHNNTEAEEPILKGKNGADGSIELGTLHFDEAGEYRYIIREHEITDETTTFIKDDKRYVLQVYVTEADSKLSVSGYNLYYVTGENYEKHRQQSGSGYGYNILIGNKDVSKVDDPELTKIVFNNRQNGYYNFEIAKTLDPYTKNKDWPDDVSFTFGIETVAGYPGEGVSTDGAPMPERTTITVNNKSTADDFIFGKAKLNPEEMYGKTTQVATGDEVEAFKRKYQAQGVTVDVRCVIYKYRIYEVNDHNPRIIYGTDTEYEGIDNIGNNNTFKDDAPSGADPDKFVKVFYNIGKLSRTGYPDEYRFVTVRPDSAGSYEAGFSRVSLKNENDFLKCFAWQGPIPFVNKLRNGEGQTTLNFTKLIEGRNFNSNDKFTFTLSSEEGDYHDAKLANRGQGGAELELQKEVTGDNVNSVDFSFGPLYYDSSDAGKTYKYTVTEQAGGSGDNTTHTTVSRTVTVTVPSTCVEKDNKLVYEVTNDQNNENNTFINTYDAAGEITFSVNKKFILADGIDENKVKTKKENFTFYLYDITNGEPGTLKDTRTVSELAVGSESSVSFKKEEYGLADAGKPHKYLIKELLNGANDDNQYTVGGIKYDPSEYIIEVDVVDNNDKTLSASITDAYYRNDNRNKNVPEDNEAKKVAEFINEYGVSGEDYINVEGDKAFHGKDVQGNNVQLKGGEFTFRLTAADDDTNDAIITADNQDGTIDMRGENGTAYEVKTETTEEGEESGRKYIEVTNDALGHFKFDKIKFTVLGKYNFVVTEVAKVNVEEGDDSINPELITYAINSYTVEVNVTDDGSGKIKAEKNIIGGPVKFDNYYGCEVPLKVKKEFDDLTGKKFKFNLYKEGDLETPIDSAETDNDGIATFGALKYKKSDAGKTFKYYIKEVVDPGANEENNWTYRGITYDHLEQEVTVTVSEDGLTASPSYVTTKSRYPDRYSDNNLPQAALFINTYAAIAEYTPEVNKVLDVGKDVLKNHPEINTEEDYQFKVSVKEVDSEGKEGPVNSYNKDENKTETVYNNPVTVTWKNGKGVFDFQSLGTPIVYNTTGVHTYIIREIRDIDQLIDQNATDEEKKIAKSKYDLVSFDPGYFKVTVTVTDKDKDGKVIRDGSLRVVPSIAYIVGDNTSGTSQEKMTFTNRLVEGGDEFEIYKTVNYGELPTGNDSFKFNIFAVDEEGNESTEPLFAKAKTYETSDGHVTFDKIPYNVSDDNKTYKYRIRELVPDGYEEIKVDGKGTGKFTNNVYVIDTNKYVDATAEIHVTDSGIEVTKKYYDENGTEITGIPTIDNEYNPVGTVQIPVNKTLTGRDMGENEQFVFDLFNVSGDHVTVSDGKGGEKNVTAVVTKGKAGESVEAYFDTLTYTKEDLDPNKNLDLGDGKTGIYYRVSEQNGGQTINGTTFDDHEYLILVVLEDLHNGTIDTKWSIIEPEDMSEGESSLIEWLVEKVKDFWNNVIKDLDHNVEFTNTYESEGKLRLGVSKKMYVVGEENVDDDMIEIDPEGEFTFILTGTDENGKKFTYPKTVPNTDTGYEVYFDDITYNKASEAPYEYKLYELHKGETLDGVTYDAHEYTVTVTVTDNATGLLTVNASINTDPAVSASSEEKTEGGKTVSVCEIEPVQVAFENVLRIKPDEIGVGGTKEVTGRNLNDGEFWFVMENTDGKKAFRKAVSNTGGTFTFPNIKYTREDLKEDNDNKVSYKSGDTFKYVIKEITPANIDTYEDLLPDGVKFKEIPGMIYDSHEITVKINVTYAKGQVKAALDETSESVSFSNTYADGDVVFKIRKTSEKAVDKTTKFWFTLTQDNNEAIKVESSDEPKKELKTYACVNGDVGMFDTIKYDLTDLKPVEGVEGKYENTFNYTVKETSGENEAYALTEDYYKIAVYVSNVNEKGEIDKTGKLFPKWTITPVVDGKDQEALPDNEIIMDFENPYNAEGFVDIPGEKEVDGDIPDGTVFQFELFQKNEEGVYTETISPELKDTNRVQLLTEGEFNYHIDYTQADIGKTYYYMVDETNTTADGIVYDPTVYFIEVVVNDDSTTPGKLDVQRHIRKSVDGLATDYDKCDPEDEDNILQECFFKNTVVKPDSIVLRAHKTMSGIPLGDLKFTFEVQDEKGNTLQVDNDGRLVKDGGTKLVAENNSGGDVYFAPIKYTLEDIDSKLGYSIFNYKIIEDVKKFPFKGIEQVESSDEGYRLTHNVAVKVERDGSMVKITEKLDDGTFHELKDDDSGYVIDGDVAKFKNKFASEIKVPFSGTKELVAPDDAAALVGYTYTFKLTGHEDGEERTETVTPKKANEPIAFDFGEIAYDQEDYIESEDRGHKFTYTVEELVPELDTEKTPNVIYTDKKYEVTVELYYDADMKLQARVSPDSTAFAFRNIYAAEGDVPFTGIKTITGKDLEDGAYTFTLSGKVGDQVISKTAQNAEDEFTFGTVHFTQDDIGDHTFTITEEAKTADGSKYDPSIYTVVVSIFVNDKGELDWSKKTYKKDDADSDDYPITDNSIEFNNTYDAYGEHPIKVKKIMHNRPLLQDEFTFILRDEKGNIVEEKNNKAAMYSRENLMAEDEIYFEALKFTQEDLKGPDGKSYLPEIQKYYTVEEVHGNKKGYTYDSTVYVVELTIKPTKNLIKEGQYEGDKHVGDYDLEVTEKIVKKNGGTAENTSEGLFARLFKGLIGNSDNVATEIIFENTYEASCVVDPPIFTKQIMGRNIQRGEFEFSIDSKDGLPSMKEFEKSVSKRMVYVPDENGGLVKSESDKGYHRVVKNGYTVTGDQTTNPGEISVDDLKFWNTDLWAFDDAEGDLETGVISKKFVYTAIEVSDVKVEGVIPSPAVFVLEFTVTDDGSGELKVSPKPEWKQITPNFLTDEQYNDTFLNLYNMEGSVEIRGIKKMDGRELTDDDVFKFTITDDQTGETATVENNWANGRPNEIVFNKDNAPFLKYRDGSFDDDGDGLYNDEIHQAGDYTYTIKEELSNKNGVEYDQTSYKVYVSVNKVTSPKAEGWLDCKVTHVEHILSDNNKTRFAIADGNHFEFDNKFKATGELKIDGTKLLVDENGNDIGSTQSLEGQYEFALYNYDSEALRARANTKGLLVDVTRTAANGDFSLTVPNGYTEQDLREKNGDYATEKTLYYKIVETKPSNGTMVGTLFESDGVIYDNTEYFVDVTLKNNGTDKLEVTKTITNATTGEQVTDVSYTNIYKNFVSIDGQKYWVDKETDPSKRPDVILNLYSSAVDNGRTIINTYTLKAPELRYRFTTDAAGKKLPATDSSGRTITYRVEELPIRGYLSEQKGYDFYNTSGDILIRKIDAETGTALSGATLAIYDGSTEIERWVSGESAHVVEKELTKGKTYTLREISAPEGYGVAADQTFTVPTDGSDITVTMADPPIIGSVRLIKRDETTRESLAGAEFALYTSAGTRIYATGTAGSYRATNLTSNGVFVTDATGSLTITDLPYGTYYFVETMAPDGYALSSEHLGFTILRSGELVEVTFLDPKALGSVRLRKANEDGSRTLAGAVFELYSATPRTVGQAATATIFTDAYFRYGTYRTNSDGEIYVGDLPWDDYFFVEVDAPTGYEVNRDVNGDDLVYTFSIDRFTANSVIDVGYVYNRPTTPPPPPTTPTPPPTTTTTTPPPTTVTTTPPPTTTTTPSGVLGERVERIEKGGVVNGVLGVRAKPTSGVLGVRSGPVTGDASNIILWLLLLCACVATIVATIVTGKKKKTGANK